MQTAGFGNGLADRHGAIWWVVMKGGCKGPLSAPPSKTWWLAPVSPCARYGWRIGERWGAQACGSLKGLHFSSGPAHACVLRLMESRLGNIESARKVFKRAIEARCTGMPSVWNGLGRLEVSAGEYDRAREVGWVNLDPSPRRRLPRWVPMERSVGFDWMVGRRCRLTGASDSVELGLGVLEITAGAASGGA